jgi:ABC-type branched-subunit amino acid transport system ATPase component
MLEISGLTVRYGPVRALNNISLRVDRGTIVALIEIGRASCRERVFFDV